MSKSREYRLYLNQPHLVELKDRYRESRMPQTCRVCRSPWAELHPDRTLWTETLHTVVPVCRWHNEEIWINIRTHPSGDKITLLDIWNVVSAVIRDARPKQAGHTAKPKRHPTKDVRIKTGWEDVEIERRQRLRHAREENRRWERSTPVSASKDRPNQRTHGRASSS